MERRHFLQLGLASASATLAPLAGASLLAADKTDREAIAKSKLGPVCRICYKCLEIAEAVEDFESLFIKRERIGKKLVEQAARMKVRHNPLSVYMLFGKPNEGREIIWVEGQNDNEILVHETGIKSVVGTLSIDPNGKWAMGENHYPITLSGLPTLFKQLLKQWEHDALHLPEVEVKFYSNAKIGETPCRVIETKQPRKQGVRFNMTRLYLHAETNLPVRTQQYEFPKQRGGKPVLYEEYTYLDMQTNIGLTDLDFDTKNPNYNF